LSATRLHGKQDKPEGFEHMKDEKETENKQSGRKFNEPQLYRFFVKEIIPMF
jgi:hypothetical protein